ncbi:MAG: hypothetical protein LBD68_09935 [Zoogloeaceae bacterium]|nr:hypothetical protein [Zoogloeaceae bacterium]
MMSRYLKPALWIVLLTALIGMPLQAQEVKKDSGILFGTIEQVGDNSIVINKKTFGFTQGATIRIGEKDHVFSRNLLSSQWVGRQAVYRYHDHGSQSLLIHLFIPTNKAQMNGG